MMPAPQPNPTFGPTQQFGPGQTFGPGQNFGPGSGDSLQPVPDPGIQTPTEVPLEQRYYGAPQYRYLPESSGSTPSVVEPTPADAPLTESQRVPTPVDPLELPGIEDTNPDNRFEELAPSDGPTLPGRTPDRTDGDSGSDPGFAPRSSNNFGGGRSFETDRPNGANNGNNGVDDNPPPIIPLPDNPADRRRTENGPDGNIPGGGPPSARIEGIDPPAASETLTLEVKADGDSKRVGQATIFTLVVTHTGPDVLEDVVIESRFDDGWTFPGRDDKLVLRPLDKLQPNSPQTVRLMLVGDDDGVLCVRFAVLVNNKPVVSKQICVDYRAESARRKPRREILPF